MIYLNRRHSTLKNLGKLVMIIFHFDILFVNFKKTRKIAFQPPIYYIIAVNSIISNGLPRK